MRAAGWCGRLAAIGVILGGLGCHDSVDRINLANSDSGRVVTAAVGDEIDVTLQTIGPGQYGVPTLSSDAVRFLGESPAGAPNPGGPRQLYRLEATAAGRALVSIAHEGGAPDAPTAAPFVITIQVR